MTRSALYDYSDAYIRVSGTLKINGAGDGDNAKRPDERSKGVIFKYCALLTNCRSCINENQIDNTEYIDVVMAMYNLIEYSNNYSKISERLWQWRPKW